MSRKVVLMAAEKDLQVLLAGMQAEQRPGEFVYCTGAEAGAGQPSRAEATIREAEGLTAVLRREDADAQGLGYDFVAAWITLRVHSALAAVGLTAAVSNALADAGISCNMLAGFYHDHLLVPAARAQDALAVLRAVQRSATIDAAPQ